MGGYGDRKGTSIGVHDPLWGQVLLLDDGKTQVGLIGLDLIAVDAACVDDLRAEIENKTGLPGAHFMIAATHTHSGPADTRLDVVGPEISSEARALRSDIRDQLVDLVAAAQTNLQPVDLSIGIVSAPPLLTNRLDPTGPVDESLSIMSVRAKGGGLLGVLVSCTGHPTVLNAENLLYSSDYPHFLRQEIQAGLGETLPVIFVNGAAGDISARYTRRASTFSEAHSIGAALGKAALEAINQAKPFSPNALNTASKQVPMPMRALLPLNEAKAQLQLAAEKLERLQAQGSEGPELRLAMTEYLGSRAALKLVEEGPQKAILARLQVISLGGLAFLSIPGELFVALGKRIKSGSEFDFTLIVGYANDYIGYILSEQAYQTQGYEARKTRLAPGAGEFLADTAVQLLQEIKRGE
jgi:hypothetical protein